jgi:hypothetical protein
MKQIGLLAAVAISATLVLPRLAAAQTAPSIPPSIITPDKVESRLGTLDFKDGAPSKTTSDKVYDAIDFAHAQRVFADTFQGVSIHASRKGLLCVGVKDNEAIIYSGLLDAKPLWLTTSERGRFPVWAEFRQLLRTEQANERRQTSALSKLRVS